MHAAADADLRRLRAVRPAALYSDKAVGGTARAHPRRFRERRGHPPDLRVRDDPGVRDPCRAGVLAARSSARNLLGILWGPDSMVPQPQDAIDRLETLQVVRRPRAAADSSTAGPIGRSSTTGRCSGGWPSSAARGCCCGSRCSSRKLLPGWMFNIAALVHGEEALLAVGFIFTFHFFNGHSGPTKFPMDT